MTPSICVHIMSPAGKLIKGGNNLGNSPGLGQGKAVGGAGTYFMDEATTLAEEKPIGLNLSASSDTLGHSVITP